MDYLINKGWKFHFGDEPEAFFKGFDDSTWESVNLPHDWSVKFTFDKSCSSGTGYLTGGTGWYRKELIITDDLEDKCVYITFGGVYKNAHVWINSNYLGKRPYGYSTFTYDITEYVKNGKNLISVKAEHPETADSRWFTGNGIYRDVTLSVVNKTHFKKYGDGIFAFTKSADKERAVINVEWSLTGEADLEFSLFDDRNNPVLVKTVVGANGNTELTVENPQLWSAEKPYLYTLKCSAKKDGRLLDEESINIGIRVFNFDAENGFFINGKSAKLKGVCIHHDAGVLGAAVPPEVWERRLKSLKEMGCNAIRTSHNPPDTHLLDLCDRLGFFVMDEAFDEWDGCKNKWWQGHNVYPPKHFGYYEDFPEWHSRDLSDMIKRDRNHPSVILWSIGNEIDYPNDPYVHHAFSAAVGNNDANKPKQEIKYDENKPDAKRLTVTAKELVKIVKEHDVTRPVTAAISFPEMSEIIGLTDTLDIAGYNYREYLYEDSRKRVPERILLGSENGNGDNEWKTVRDNGYMSGQFIWTGIDYLGEARGWPVRVSPSGFIDLSGFPKPSYYKRKAMWSEKLTSKAVTVKCGENAEPDFSWDYKNGEKVTVICYTNGIKAELFLNGVSMGKKELSDEKLCEVSWDINYCDGEITVVAEGENGETITDCLKTPNGEIHIEPNEIVNGDIFQTEVLLKDENGTLVTKSDRELTAHCENGEILGLENGIPDDLTPYTSKTRKTKNGRLIVYSTGTVIIE